MKPKLFDKILLALLLIVVIAVALALIGMAACLAIHTQGLLGRL